MSFRDCVQAIVTAAGRPLSEDEVQAIAEAVHARMSRKVRAGIAHGTAAQAAGQEVADELQLQAALKRRAAYDTALKRQTLLNRVQPGEEAQSERAILSGRVDSVRRGEGAGIEQAHHALRERILGPLANEIHNTGLSGALTGGLFGRRDRAFELNVARELWRRESPTSAPATGDAMAAKAADILGRTLDLMRAMQNKAGAWIGQLDNYMGRQYHDMLKVRGDGGAAGYQAWRDFIAPRLDLERTYPDLEPAQIEDSLKATWRALANGVFGRDAPDGYRGPANLAGKASAERSLFFRDADAWFEYNEKFGRGSVMDAVVAGADRAARNTALMDALGTNPSATWDWLHQHLVDQAMARDDHAMVDRLHANWNEKVFDTVSGKASIPGNATLAYIGSTVREAMQLVHLGKVVFSAIPDTVVSASTLRANGINIWAGFANQLRAMLPQTENRLAVARMMGAGIDGMMNSIVHRFGGGEGVPGMMSKAVNTFHHLNGMTYWTDHQKIGMALALSHNLAFHAGEAFDALPVTMQDTLRRYGIEGPEWDTARATAATAADGRNYLLPAHIADEPMAQKFQTYITDQVRKGLNESTAWSRAFATQGTRPGTPEGEFARSFAQFKNWSLVFMQRHMGQMLRQKGVDLPGVAYLMTGMALTGFAGIVLRDLSNNETPPDPQDAEGWANLATAAIVQGGSLGLLGDTLLRNNTNAGDVIGDLAGPTFGAAAQVVADLNAIRAGEKTKSRGQIAEEKGLKLLLSNSPNLFYTAAAYNYFLPYLLTEKVQPGTIQRREQLMRQHGQTFVLRP